MNENNNDNINYRHIISKDIPAIVQLEINEWGDSMSAGRELWEKRIKIFSKGIFVAEERNEIIGVVVAHIIDWNYALGEFPSWEEATADGTIMNHNIDGDKKNKVVYGVDVAVHPKKQGIAGKLLELSITIVSDFGISRGIMGSRIPTLDSFVKANGIKVLNEENVFKYAPEDISVSFFISHGLKLLGVKENYFPSDKESRGWGAILEARP